MGWQGEAAFHRTGPPRAGGLALTAGEAQSPPRPQEEQRQPNQSGNVPGLHWDQVTTAQTLPVAPCCPGVTAQGLLPGFRGPHELGSYEQTAPHHQTCLSRLPLPLSTPVCPVHSHTHAQAHPLVLDTHILPTGVTLSDHTLSHGCSHSPAPSLTVTRTAHVLIHTPPHTSPSTPHAHAHVDPHAHPHTHHSTPFTPAWHRLTQSFTHSHTAPSHAHSCAHTHLHTQARTKAHTAPHT